MKIGRSHYLRDYNNLVLYLVRTRKAYVVLLKEKIFTLQANLEKSFGEEADIFLSGIFLCIRLTPSPFMTRIHEA